MLLKVEDLSVYFSLPRTKLWEKPQFFHAVRNVSFEIAAKTSFGLVGESGSGKTTTGMAAIRLIPPTSGRVLFEGEDLCPVKRSGNAPAQTRYSAYFPGPLFVPQPAHACR